MDSCPCSIWPKMATTDATVLLLPAGSGMAVAAIQALRRDPSIRIIAADMNRLAAGMYLADAAYMVPLLEHPAFFDLLFDIIAKESVDAVIPALDPFLIPFAERRADIERHGAHLLLSPTKSLRITRDKWITYNHLKAHIPVPTSWIEKEAIDIPFPLFIKPRAGSGSVDAIRLDDDKKLDYYFRHIELPIVQDFLPGVEYTVDCLADTNGRLLTSIPRKRLDVRNGVCTKSQIICSDHLDSMATKVSSLVRFSGPFFFQAIEDAQGIPRLTEVNPRISGTMSLSSASGWNIHVNAVRMLLGKPVVDSAIKFGIYVSRYLKDIYLDDEDLVQW